MTDLPDRFKLRWMWLNLPLGCGFLPGLMLAPYFGSAQIPWCVATGMAGLGSGLWARYRSPLGMRYRIAMACFLFGFVFMIVAGAFGTVLKVVVHAPDLMPWGVVIVLVGGFVPLVVCIVQSARVVAREPASTRPPWLRNRVDLDTGVLSNSAPPGVSMPPPSWAQRHMAMLSALVLNIPLALRVVGKDPYSWTVVLLPAMLWALSRVAFVVGRELPFMLELQRLERERGQPFITHRLDEVRALRRSFWFARWLVRPQDLMGAAEATVVARDRAARRGHR